MSVDQGIAERYQICRAGRSSARCFNVPTRMLYALGSCGSAEYICVPQLGQKA
jgi:hypothetical protein